MNEKTIKLEIKVTTKQGYEHGNGRIIYQRGDEKYHIDCWSKKRLAVAGRNSNNELQVIKSFVGKDRHERANLFAIGLLLEDLMPTAKECGNE